MGRWAWASEVSGQVELGLYIPNKRLKKKFVAFSPEYFRSLQIRIEYLKYSSLIRFPTKI